MPDAASITIGGRAIGSYLGNEQIDLAGIEAQRSVRTHDAYEDLTRTLGASKYLAPATFDWARSRPQRASYGADASVAGSRLVFSRWYFEPAVRVLVTVLPGADVKGRRLVGAQKLALTAYNQYLAASDDERKTGARFAPLRADLVIPDISSQPGASRRAIGFLPVVKNATVSGEQIRAVLAGEILDLIEPQRNQLQERLSRDQQYDFAGRHGPIAGMPSTVERPLLRPRDDIR